MQTTATKAHVAGGVGGAITGLLMLAMHFTGNLTLSGDQVVDYLAIIGTALGGGIATWLGAYAPTNKPK